MDTKNWVNVSIFMDRGIPFVKVEDVKRHLSMKSTINVKHGTIMLIKDKTVFSMISDIPVININGLFKPLHSSPIMKKNSVWIPLSMLEKIFYQKMVIHGKIASWQVDSSKIPPYDLPQYPKKINVHEMIQYLSFLKAPLKGAHVSVLDSSLPGATRAYRKGIHEGIDWYSYDTGIRLTQNTPVFSMAEGMVVRADHHYREMSMAQRQKTLSQARSHQDSPEYILDKLRGRSVWIQHGKGVLIRYVHLDRIPDKLQVGKNIKSRELLGYIGNSGTSDGVKRSKKGLHLHIDILIYGQWFWENYTLKETKFILQNIFPPS